MDDFDIFHYWTNQSAHLPNWGTKSERATVIPFLDLAYGMRVHSLSLETHSRLQQLARDHATQCQNVGFKSVPVQQIFYNPHKLLQPHK